MSVYFSDLDHAVFFTLSYSDYFNFPLTKKEIHQRLAKVWDWRFLIGQKLTTSKLMLKRDKAVLQKSLESLEKKEKIASLAKGKTVYYFLKGRQDLVGLRSSKKTMAKNRQSAINQASNYLQRFPSIKAVFLTGSSALNNADLDDDLDFCLIVKKNTLWISRFFVILLAKILGKQPQIDAQAKNNNKQAWCLNLWLDESSLNIVNRGFSIYQAYELKQMRSLFDRDNLKEKILLNNKQFAELLALGPENEPNLGSKNKIFDYCLWLVNVFFYALQNIYRYLLFGKEDYFINLQQAHFNQFDRQEKIFKDIKNKMKANAFSDF